MFDILDIFLVAPPFSLDEDGTGKPILVTWRTTTLAIPWQSPTITAIPYDESDFL